MATSALLDAPRRGRSRRTIVWAIGGLALVFAAAAGGRLWRSAQLQGSPTGPARWVWIERSPHDRRSVAFHAATDFAVAGPPRKAELSILADEEYLLFLNGRRIGSGIYRPGAPLDTYEVGSLLERGSNRVVLELRSGRGAGGVLASLRDARGEFLFATGAGWRVFPEQVDGLLEGDLALGEAPRVVVWGLPPTGRWGFPRAGVPLPLFDDVVTGRALLPVATATLGGPLEWQLHRDGLRFTRRSPQGRRPGVAFDFGREVFGYLNLTAMWRVPRPTALLFAGDRPFDPLAGALRLEPGLPSAVGDLPPGAVVITVPGRRHWSDAVPRRLRYAAVLGWRGVGQAWVDEVEPGPAAALAGPPPLEPPGVFGIEPPPQRTPIEDEVRRELQRLSDLARKDR